jgi:hypothetical protein
MRTPRTFSRDLIMHVTLFRDLLMYHDRILFSRCRFEYKALWNKKEGK